MGKGSNTTTSTSQPPAQVLQNYQNVTGQAGNVANTQYQPYSGSVVAGFTPEQQTAFANTNSAAGLAQPYVQQAANLVGAATSGIDPTATLSQYESPYTSQVVNATEQQLQNVNQQQAAQLTGNAVAQGAYGGDRAAVAQGVLAGQQDAQEAPVIANLENTGYNNALQTGLQTQEANAWLNSQGAFALGQLGSEAQTAGLQGAQAQLGVGNQQQQLAQNELNVPYQSYQAAQGYPFQTTSWLSGIDTGLGSQEGGTSSTTAPGPSITSQVGGLGLAGLGAYALLAGANGGAVPGFDSGGVVPTVPDVSVSVIPTAGLSPGRGMGLPQAPRGTATDPTQQGMQFLQGAEAVRKIGGIGGAGSSNSDLASAFGDLGDAGWVDAVPGFDDGGGVSPVLASGLGSGNPMISGLLQRYQSLPTEQLQEMAVRYPPNTQQGQMVQMMLHRRQMSPQSDPGQQQAGVASQSVPTSAAQAQPIAGFADGGDTSPVPLPAEVTDPSDYRYYVQHPFASQRDVPPLPAGVSYDTLHPDTAAQASTTPSAAPELAKTAGLDAPTGSPEARDVGAGTFMPAASAAGAPMMRTAGMGTPRLADDTLPTPPVPPEDAAPDSASPDDAPKQAGMGDQPPAEAPKQAGFLDRLLGTGKPGDKDHSDFYSKLSGPAGALLMAGLGIMGGRSPYAVENIGQGAQMGLSWAEKQQQLREQTALRQQQAQWQNDYHQGIVDARKQQAENQKQAVADRAAQMQDARDARQQQMSIEYAKIGLQRDAINLGKYTYQPVTQPDPNDPTKTISGYVKLSNRGDQDPEFIPTLTNPNKGAGGNQDVSGREAVYFNRVAAAGNEAALAAANVMELPLSSTSTGWFGGRSQGTGLLSAAKEALTNSMTSQDVQTYNTMIAGVSRNLAAIEASGLAPSGSLTHSMDVVTLKEGDSELTKMRKMAELRQVVEKGLEPNLSNPRLPDQQKQLVTGIIKKIQTAIPFTQHDLTAWQRDPSSPSFSDYAKKNGLATYEPVQQQTAQPQRAAPIVPPLPAGVPPGSQYSPSRNAWRDPSGKIYPGAAP